MQPRQLEAEVRKRWDFDDPSASYDVMIATAAEAPPGSAERLVWQTQAARALAMQRRFDDATQLLGEVAAAAEQLPNEIPTRHVQARVAIERGRVANSSGNPEGARRHFEEAQRLAEAAGTEGLAVDALHMLAIVAGQTQSAEVSRALNEEAIARAERSDDPEARRWRASLLNNLGWDLHDAGLFEDALVTFERALELRLESDDAGATHVARWAVARALRSLDRHDEALVIQETLAESPEGAADGYVYEELGECLLALSRPEAAAAFARAHELLGADDWLVEHEPDRIARLASLAAAH
jgi:tetratricopeptide (TPR) repeat protein